DSSGELFGNGGDSYWVSDVSEARNIRRERGDGGSGEKETLCGQFGVFDAQGNESGYGSEPGYRGDGEFGYGDEVDEEEDDNRLLLWGDHFGAMLVSFNSSCLIYLLIMSAQGSVVKSLRVYTAISIKHEADAHSKMEIVGENTFSDQKAHHRCRRKKHDYRMVDSLRLIVENLLKEANANCGIEIHVLLSSLRPG
ncbi:hypothetical protein Goklo_013666, partial [Gossypium klotzschianum]|nr:hypothetical protein [Gossypium klotzschianum]